eukprot:TRINITY_DN1108_c0_g1_i2.p1 TRINITY_DN1108_c0_g1~~TRINITY_DN1108_c0_g1_i2.p1  ORF type:complete len:245 (-),score=34.77 TRINITY_DN1108_c0_g1_i2:42-776(-)
MKRLLILFSMMLACECTREFDFMKGFLASMQETADPEPLDNCLKDLSAAFANFVGALRIIRTKQVANMLSGIKMFLSQLKLILNMVEPCCKGFDKLKSLSHILKLVKPLRAALEILHDVVDYMRLIDNCLKALNSKTYNEAGKQLGMFTLKLFVTTEKSIGSPVQATSISNENINNDFTNDFEGRKQIPTPNVIDHISTVLTLLFANKWSCSKEILSTIAHTLDILNQIAVSYTHLTLPTNREV